MELDSQIGAGLAVAIRDPADLHLVMPGIMWGGGKVWGVFFTTHTPRAFHF